MSNYDNTNRGVLFGNDRKETDSHPDMTGSLNINGVEHWFSGWWKQGAKGDFLSLSIGKPKDQQQQQPPQRQQAPQQRASERGGYRQPQRQGQPQGRGPSNGFDDDQY